MLNFEQIASFWDGLGIGVAASVLVAPEAGVKTRNRIRDIASRAGDVLRKGAQDSEKRQETFWKRTN